MNKRKITNKFAYQAKHLMMKGIKVIIVCMKLSLDDEIYQKKLKETEELRKRIQ